MDAVKELCRFLRENNIAVLFWTCPAGCRGRVEWSDRNGTNPLAVCQQCGMTNHRHQD